MATSSTAGQDARIVELEAEVARLTATAEADNRAANNRVAELEGQVATLTAQLDRLAHSGTPLIALSPMGGDKVNEHGVLTAEESKGLVYGYHRAISFKHDPGYSVDAMRGRASEAAAYAVGGPLVGDPNSLSQAGRFSNMPKFSPESRLHIMVWVEYRRPSG